MAYTRKTIDIYFIITSKKNRNLWSKVLDDNTDLLQVQEIKSQYESVYPDYNFKIIKKRERIIK